MPLRRELTGANAARPLVRRYWGRLVGLSVLGLIAFAACQSAGGEDPASTEPPVVTQPGPEQPGVDGSTSEVPSAQPTEEDIFAFDRGSEEHLLFLQACLADLGFSVEIDAFAGSVTADMGGQPEAYDAAWWECKTRAEDAGLDYAFRPRTEEELRLGYEGRLLLQDCLVENGYEVGPVPSEEAFVESGGQWHPFEAIPFAWVTNLPENSPPDLVAAMEASRELRETCEENPAYWVRLARGDEG
jgi:hypothetical protein